MDLIKEFTEHLASQSINASKATIKNYRADVAQFIKWFEKEFDKTFKPEDITPQIINVYKNSRLLSPRSLERHLSSFNRFFKFLVEKKLVNKNPLEEINISLKKKTPQNKWGLSEFKTYLYINRSTPLTIKNYFVDIRQFFVFLEKTLAPSYTKLRTEKEVFSKITQPVLSEYKFYLLTPNHLGGMGLLPSTVNRKLSSLRKYFSWAQTQNLIDVASELTISNERIIKVPFASIQLNQPSRSQEPQELEAVQKYSSFPPKRLLQKMVRAVNFLIDNTITIALARIIEQAKEILWELRGRPIFRRIIGSKQKTSVSISTHYLPLYKRVLDYLKHTRPKWYKKYHSYSIVHYLHFAILVILMSAIGTAIYNDSWGKTKKDVLSSNIDISQTRILSLKGRLTDSLDNAIVSSNIPLRVAIYNDAAATGSALVWQELVVVNPDKDGLFETTLGENTPLPQSIFFLHPSLWLGVSVREEPELVPRQEIATISYATNSQTLQGLPPINKAGAGTKNVVLALDSSGNLTIGESSSPVFQATGGSLTLSGKVLVLSTIIGSSANVIISPDSLGKIDFQKPLQNTSENNNISTAIGALEVNDLFAVLATSSGQAAFTLNQDSTGPLISASSSGIAKFTVENSGTIVSAVGANWQPTFDAKNALNIASASGVPFVTFDTVGLNVGIGNAIPEKTLDVLGSFRATGEIAFPALKLNGGILYATKSGVLTQIDPGKNTDCLFGGETPKFSSCPFAGFTDLLTIENNRLGIGTKTPLFKLDIQESKDSTAAAQIFNTSTNTDADGLVIKLGNTSGSVANSNRFISFETVGIGIVGSIRGDADKGIEFKTQGIADFAEYIKKDKNQTIEYGSIVCINEKGLAVACDQDNRKIIGVASNHGGFTGGKDLGGDSIRVGFVGQVYTKVSNANGEINPGDPLTASSIPGVAIKATMPGQIIGKALERLPASQGDALQSQKILAYINLGWYDPTVYLTSTGEIELVKEDGSEHIGNNNDETGPYILKSPFTKSIKSIGIFTESIIANLKVGFLKAEEITTNSLTVATDSITIEGKRLKDYIASSVETILNTKYLIPNTNVVSPIAKIDEVRTNIISPLSSDSLVIHLGGVHPNFAKASLGESSTSEVSQKLVVENASGSAVATIDSSGNASFSGILTSSKLYADKDATIGGTLTANKIVADSIEGLEAKVSTLAASEVSSIKNQVSSIEDKISATSDILNTKYLILNTDFGNVSSYSAQLLATNLNSAFATITQGLISFGPTSLAETAIAGPLYIEGSLVLAGNSINVLGNSLEFQSLRQGGISFLAGLIEIDKDGNLRAAGNAEFAKNLKVGGVLSAGDIIASGSGTFGKLNLSLVKPALALSNTEAIATGSAGVAAIKSLQTELTIKNHIVTDKSLIYITPVGTPSGQMPFLMRQTPEEPARSGVEGSFTVGVQLSSPQETIFNWLIVN